MSDHNRAILSEIKQKLSKLDELEPELTKIRKILAEKTAMYRLACGKMSETQIIAFRQATLRYSVMCIEYSELVVSIDDAACSLEK